MHEDAQGSCKMAGKGKLYLEAKGKGDRQCVSPRKDP